MRRLVLLILAVAMLFPSMVQAYDVLILQSRRTAASDEVLKGFAADRKSSLRKLVMADYAEMDLVRIVREDRPRLILAVGDAAVKAAHKLHNIPVLAAMSMSLTGNDHSSRNDNLCGIGMIASPEQYLGLFQRMNKRRIGVIHNPAKNGWYLRLARKAAADSGIELVVRELLNPRDSQKSLASLAGKIDALWMLPDSTAVTRETVEGYFLFAQEQNIPLVSFSGAYLGMGAAAVLDIAPYALGKQADEIAQQILRGGTLPSGTAFPHNVSIKTNPAVLKRLGLQDM